MINREIAEYPMGIVTSALTVLPPVIVATAIPTFNYSEPGRPHPLREMDLLGIPNFFDHTGNMDNASLICAVTLFAGSEIYGRIDEAKKDRFIIGSAVCAGVLSGGAVVTNEVVIPPFDTADALLGGSVSILYPLVFAIAALKTRARLRKQR
jgi:hypothetical protein